MKKSGVTELFGTILILVGILTFIALMSLRSQLAAGTPVPGDNLIGTVGHYCSEFLLYMFGNSAFLLGPYLFVLGLLTIYRGGFTDPLSRVVAVVTVMIGTSLLGALLNGEAGQPSRSAGGMLGSQAGGAFQMLFGAYGSVILSLGILITGVFLAIRIPVPVFLHRLRDQLAGFLGAYGELFSKNMYEPAPRAETPRPAPPPVAQKTPDRREFMRAEVASVRPWLERVVVEDRTADEKPAGPTKDEAVETPQPPPETGVAASNEWNQKNQQLAGRARRLEEALAALRPPEDRRSAPRSNELRTRATPAAVSRESFEGYFNDDESRFHFRSVLPASSGRAIERRRRVSSSPVPGVYQADQSERLMRDIDLSVLEKPRPGQSERLTRWTDEADFGGPARRRDEPVTPSIDEEQYESADVAADPFEPEMALEAVGRSQSSEYDYESDPATEEAADPEEHDSLADTGFSGQAMPARPAPVEERSVAPRRVLSEESDELPLSAVPDFEGRGRRYSIPLDVLQPGEHAPVADISQDIEQTKRRLEQVMQDYGIQGRVVRTQRGPVITLYEVKLEPGVKVSKILGIQDEIKMNLEAPSVRIIAPIPGKSTVGIELPNRQREQVVLRDLLRNERDPGRDLAIVLGKNIAGERVHVDLTRLPHLLIAGATGSGKSVYLNAVIASLLFSRSPEDVRFIMIDPKMVELKLFEGIPHLIMPVITDVRLASKALNWIVAEMERRYTILSRLRCRDIRSYNERLKAGTLGRADLSHMPYIVVVIDELSDLMMVAAKDVEDSIIRLTQKARAVGIHVVMATQRPSVDVITALIKANCPARIAFHVAQKTDSRTILDANGAETLLGRGDLLYKSPTATGLSRIQAPLITEEEIESIVQRSRRFGEPAYVDLEEESNDSLDDQGEVDPELFEQAWQVILESGKTSTSYLQRRLRIGYNRAANIIELLEQKGYLGPAIGNKPREIVKRS